MALERAERVLVLASGRGRCQARLLRLLARLFAADVMIMMRKAGIIPPGYSCRTLLHLAMHSMQAATCGCDGRPCLVAVQAMRYLC